MAQPRRTVDEKAFIVRAALPAGLAPGSLCHAALTNRQFTGTPYLHAIYTSMLSPSVSKHGITSFHACSKPLVRMKSFSV